MFLPLSGCATMFSGTTQDIEIKVIDQETKEPIEGAKIIITELSSGKKTAFSNASNELEVKRSNSKLKIKVSHPKYLEESMEIDSSKNGLRHLNLIFHLPALVVSVGLFQTGNFAVGMPLFILSFVPEIIDTSTGAGFKYPGEIVIELEKK